MCEAALPYVKKGYQLVLAGAPSVAMDFYAKEFQRLGWEVQLLPAIVQSQTYPLLSHATAALVTSGTATLETALFRVPQVVCYYIAMGKVVNMLRRWFLKVKYISLVNLVANEEVVPELVADAMNVDNVSRHLQRILPGGDERAKQLAGYERMAEILGEPGAPQHAAQEIVERLQSAR